MSDTISKEFVALGREVAKSGKAQPMTVRELLKHFGQERRGSEVIRFINYKLRYLGLDTSPRFDEVHIDGSINVIPRPKRPRGRPFTFGTKKPVAVEVAGPTAAARKSPTEVSATLAGEDEAEEPRQPFLRIGLLGSANTVPHSVRGSDTLETAVTLLMMHDITHIPVMPAREPLKASSPGVPSGAPKRPIAPRSGRTTAWNRCRASSRSMHHCSTRSGM